MPRMRYGRPSIARASSDLARRHQRADPRTGDDLAVDLDRLGHLERHVRLGAELPQDLDVARAVVAEEEVRPLDHRPGRQPVADDAVEELAGLPVPRKRLSVG